MWYWRSSQRSSTMSWGAGARGVHAEAPGVLVRIPLEPLPHLLRGQLVAVLPERRRLVERDLPLLLAAMRTALALLGLPRRLLPAESHVRDVAAELLDLLHLRH